MKTSEQIKARLDRLEKRYFSTDNISDVLLPGDLEKLTTEVAENFEEVLKSLVINIDDDHNTKETAKRVAKMMINETFGGRYQPMPNVTDFPNVASYDHIYIAGPISIRSTCAHHFQPIIGNCFIGVIPGKNVIGLSKFNRIAHWIAERPQIQEEMTQMIADQVEDLTKADGVAIVIKANHLCVTHRGVKEHESDMVTSIMRGKFRTDALVKSEFISLLQGMKGYSN